MWPFASCLSDSRNTSLIQNLQCSTIQSIVSKLSDSGLLDLECSIAKLLCATIPIPWHFKIRNISYWRWLTYIFSLCYFLCYRQTLAGPVPESSIRVLTFSGTPRTCWISAVDFSSFKVTKWALTTHPLYTLQKTYIQDAVFSIT